MIARGNLACFNMGRWDWGMVTKWFALGGIGIQ